MALCSDGVQLMLSDIFRVSYLLCEGVVQSYILGITYITINASSGADSILYILYFTYFEIAVQTQMYSIG